MNIRPYERGDAPEIRKGYLEGLILQDGSFISEGKTFFIHDDGAEGPHVVSSKVLFVEEESE